MADILFELVSPERILFSGAVRAVMMPGSEGDMTVMSGHEPAIVALQPGIIVVTDVQGHGHRAFVRGGIAEVTGGSVTILAERALPPEELSRESLEEEIVRMETIREATRDDAARRNADAAIARLQQVKATLSF
ncbi:ATP synthase F1 subunit epsilon [Microvirga thermotolerans]|uniref:ATP synthase epsilon chain n=1 Tax=Microvirga thermotolerans TaxID=2651334 RepID=A0A5P9JXV0_9HYPH|nr:ATP synthase F1 subunit epsilon [Microvirga thermotolerans]QFU14784.1 ATP synthase F1 subunit epsilon [Microvirga thermotolerans]